MTIEEAYQCMKEGKRVTHKSFTSDEYFEMYCGVVVCENGYSMSDWFRNEEWQKDGWSIKQEK